MASWHSRHPAQVEALEPRYLFSVSTLAVHPSDAKPESTRVDMAMAKRADRRRITPNINVSRMQGNQTEGTIATDPTDSSHLFIASNMESQGLFTAVSNDGGVTWSRQVIADGADNLPSACCDPSVTFDEYGNLYLTYVDANTIEIQVVMSADGGFSFRHIASFRGDIDQPTITTGNSMLWITFQSNQRVAAAGAAINGPDDIDPFGPVQRVPSRRGSNFGDIAVGERGQVMVTYIHPATDQGPAAIYVNVDPDGLGPQGFSRPRFAATTNVGGFRSIPAQNIAKIDAEPGLAYDRSRRVANGRVYMVYTDAPSVSSSNTYVAMRYSDNDGLTWSNPIRINDSRSANTQFLPRIALDQSTGNVALTWYDTRNVGLFSSRFFGAVGRPTSSGISIAPSFQISRGTSNAGASGNSIDYGDYNGLAFANGIIHPIWSDNSNSTRDNPNGARSTFDQYTTRIAVA